MIIVVGMSTAVFISLHVIDWCLLMYGVVVFSHCSQRVCPHFIFLMVSINCPFNQPRVAVNIRLEKPLCSSQLILTTYNCTLIFGQVFFYLYFASGTISDLYIGITLCYFLQRSRTGFNSWGVSLPIVTSAAKIDSKPNRFHYHYPNAVHNQHRYGLFNEYLKSFGRLILLVHRFVDGVCILPRCYMSLAMRTDEWICIASMPF